MVRALVLYEGQAPDRDRYEQHIRDFCDKVPGATFRHGRIFGAAVGEQKYHYYAEFEWPDKESMNQAMRSPEFAATGADAIEMGIPFYVLLAELSE